MPRLPIPGQDKDTWGDILNNYLLVAHNNEGILRANTVGNSQIQDNVITETKLHPDVVTQLQSVGITPLDKSKLDGIAVGATVNASDAQLRDRSTHTGTQAISTIANLQSELGGKANTADLAQVAMTGNYAHLTNLPTIPAAQVNADWNATSGVAQILNKPTIPDVSGFATTSDLTAGLNGKANTSHQHAAADITSGVFTADRLPVASDTTAGIVELATAAEAETGTDTTRAVTPAGVKAAIDAVVGAAPVAGQVLFVDSLGDIPLGTPVDTLVVVRAN